MALPNRVAQIAFVVRDIEQARHRFAKLFGCEPPEVMTTPPGLEVGQTFEGEPSDAQAHLAFFNLENVQIELIQPTGGNSSWQQFLDQHGEGVHHLGFWTEDMAASRAELESQGYPMFHRGDFPGGEFAYHNSGEAIGALIELLGKR